MVQHINECLKNGYGRDSKRSRVSKVAKVKAINKHERGAQGLT